MSEHPYIPDGPDPRIIAGEIISGWQPITVTRSSNLPAISVEPGTDASISGNPENPSGLEHLSTRQLDELLALVREEVTSVIQFAPQSIVDLGMPGDLHVPVYAKDTNDLACIHARWANNLGQLETDVGRFPLGYALPKLGGLVINPSTISDLDNMRFAIGHEAFHILTLNGMHGYFKGPIESLVARMEKEKFGEQRTGLTKSMNWDRSRFVGSAGLCPPDFFSVDYCDQAYEALYLSSYFAADELSIEQVWQIWEELLSSANTIGLSPRFREMYQAIMRIGPQGEKLLQTIPFQPLKPGVQTFAFPTKSGSRPGASVHFNSIAFTQNPNAGRPTTDSKIDDRLYFSAGANRQYRHQVYDKSNRLIRGIDGVGSIGPRDILTFDGMTLAIKSDRRNWKDLKEHIGNRMSFTISGISEPVFIENENGMTSPAKSTPSKRDARKKKKEERRRKRR